MFAIMNLNLKKQHSLYKYFLCSARPISIAHQSLVVESHQIDSSTHSKEEKKIQNEKKIFSGEITYSTTQGQTSP